MKPTLTATAPRCAAILRRIVHVAAATTGVIALVGTAGARALVVPIPNELPPLGVPTFTGAPASSTPAYYPAPPRDPFMAPNGHSNLHDDAYMSNTYERPGPLGNGMSVRSTTEFGPCATVVFDRSGRLLTVCVRPQGPILLMLDARTLAPLASFNLPPRQPSLKELNVFSDFGGGGYLYLDNQGRLVIPTTTRHIEVIGEDGPAPGFHLVRDYDLSALVPAKDELTSALPDWHGLIWFESFDGVVGTINPHTGAVHAVDTHEETENSFAIDPHGVYIVTTKALYRWGATADGSPKVGWRVPYPNSGIHKPGQIDAGSGTTPTLMGTRYVAIADNADPMDVVVYQRSVRIHGPREVCRQPVFSRGASDTENGLIGTAGSIIVENNYGYSSPLATELGRTTTPGLARVDINRSGHGCHVVWRSNEIAPTVVPKLSLSTGLIYAYTKPSGLLNPWYFTALSFATGRTVYKQLTGTGFGYNNTYTPITLSPNGTAYVGAFGGLIEVRDATPPPFLTAPPPKRPQPPARRHPRICGRRARFALVAHPCSRPEEREER